MLTTTLAEVQSRIGECGNSDIGFALVFTHLSPRRTRPSDGPLRAVGCPLLGARARRMLTGACNPMLGPMHASWLWLCSRSSGTG